MNTETPSTNQITPEIESDVYYIATGAQKLNSLFGDPKHARTFLTRDGWFNQEGADKLGKNWSAYTLCYALMKTSLENVPKEQWVVDLINARLKDTGCAFTLRRRDSEIMFGLMATNFFWFGGRGLQ